MGKPNITLKEHIARFTLHAVPDRPGVAADVFGRLGAEGHAVSMLTTAGGAGGKTEVSFIVDADHVDAVTRILEAMRTDLGFASVECRRDIVSVRLDPEGLSQAPGIAGKIFRVLSQAGINIEMIAANDACVTCVLDGRFGNDAKKALEEAFTESTG